MDRSAAQDGSSPTGREERCGSDFVNRIARAKARQDFEKANPVPARGVLGPVPSIPEQTRALMQDPGWLVREMRRREAEELPVNSYDPDQIYPEDDDWDDDEPEMFTGYQLKDMEPVFPADPDPKDRQARNEAQPANASEQGADPPEGDGAV